MKLDLIGELAVVAALYEVLAAVIVEVIVEGVAAETPEESRTRELRLGSMLTAELERRGYEIRRIP